MVVVCRDEETAVSWQKRAFSLEGFAVTTVTGCRSYYQAIQGVLAQDGKDPVILCHDDICCGLGFIDAVRELLAELEHTHVCWGVCGNAGISWDGHQAYRYIRDPHGGPRHGLAVEQALGIDGNLMLLNVPALRSAGVTVPDLGGFHGYDIVLSLECLRRGLPVLCDRRLFVMHRSAGDGPAFQSFCRSKPFQDYMAGRFVNHALPTINGLVDVSLAQNYQYLDILEGSSDQQDFVELFDAALAGGRKRRPAVTIACRSRFDRPEMLVRAVGSFAVAAEQAPDLVDLKVRIVSDRSPEIMSAEVERLRSMFPGLDLEGWVVPADSGRFSRTAALLCATERAESDYLWFVDDDDFVQPGAMRPLARALAPGASRLLVGHSQRIEEFWEVLENGERRLSESRLLGRNRAEDIFLAFSGDNHTPICSLLFPVETLRDRVSGMAARGDYYEDYFLLLLVLGAARVEVRTVQADLCGISLRPGENTVNEPDRRHWDLSYATFVSELLRCPQATSPLLWQLAERSAPWGAPPPPAGRTGLDRGRDPRSWRDRARRFIHVWRTEGAGNALGKALRRLFPVAGE